MGPEDAQLAHAQTIRDRRVEDQFQRSASPEDKLRAMVASELNRLFPGMFAAAIAAADARVQITGNGCTVSGKFPTLTITVDPPPLRVVSVTPTCNDDGTISVEVVVT